MSLKKVTAIFHEIRLQSVENELLAHGVSGFSVSKVKGRGRYFDSFNPSHLTEHVELCVYTNAAHADKIAHLIIEAAQVDVDSEGMLVVQPIDKIYWIHEKAKAKPKEFNFNP